MDKKILQKREDYIINLLENWSGDIDDIEKLLRKAMEYADAHPLWTPVKEELPEVRQSVLFRVPGFNEPLTGYLEEGGLGFWAYNDDDYWENVTHWKPLSSIEDLEKL
jgi:hypothetical protein